MLLYSEKLIYMMEEQTQAMGRNYLLRIPFTEEEILSNDVPVMIGIFLFVTLMEDNMLMNTLIKEENPFSLSVLCLKAN